MTPIAIPSERTGFPASPDLKVRREGLAAALDAGMWRVEPPPTILTLGGVRCLEFLPAGPARATIVHMHGGAFRIGCPEQIAPFAKILAERCAARVICPTYRLAPEHPFPAGLNDGWALLQSAAAQGTAPIILSGDSAGGALAAALMVLCAQSNITIIGLTLLSPWLDLSVNRNSYAANAASDPLFSADAAREAAELYLQGAPANNPLASPFHADVSAFPPTYINVGEGEVLLDEAMHFHQKLVAANSRAILHQVANMDHVAVTRDPNLPGSAETMAALCAFIEGTFVTG